MGAFFEACHVFCRLTSSREGPAALSCATFPESRHSLRGLRIARTSVSWWVPTRPCPGLPEQCAAAPKKKTLMNRPELSCSSHRTGPDVMGNFVDAVSNRFCGVLRQTNGWPDNPAGVGPNGCHAKPSALTEIGLAARWNSKQPAGDSNLQFLGQLQLAPRGDGVLVSGESSTKALQFDEARTFPNGIHQSIPRPSAPGRCSFPSVASLHFGGRTEKAAEVCESKSRFGRFKIQIKA